MSKGENMVERCARAIFDTWSEHQDGYAVHQMTWDDAVQAADDPEKYPKMAKIVPMARAEARAVIEEMRTPTHRMLKAAAKAMSPGKRPTPTWVSGAAKHGIRYRAMIDTALNEDSPLRTILSQPNDEGEGK